MKIKQMNLKENREQICSDKIEHIELLIYTLEIPITTKLGSIN